MGTKVKKKKNISAYINKKNKKNRHPACGYVQGMNEIVTPFFIVFFEQYVKMDEKQNYPIPEGLDLISE